MKNILIVDDDKIIRGGIRTIISGSHLNSLFAIAGEAPNGARAFEIVEKNKIDILITDIKMPIMDGLELIRRVKEFDGSIRVIVLSGFDEYKFVREAMKLGAMDYLLKPVANDQLCALVEKAGIEIDQNIVKMAHYETVNKKLNESKSLLKEKLLRSLVAGSLTRELAEASMREAGVCDADIFIFIIVGVGKTVNGIDSGYIKSQIDALSEENDFSISYEVGNYIYAMFYTREENITSFRDYILRSLIGLIESNNSQEGEGFVSIGMSRNYNDLSRTYIAYHQAEFALNRCFFEGNGKVIEYNAEDSIYGELNESDLGRYIDALVNSLELGDWYKTKLSIEEIIRRVSDYKLSPVRIKETFAGIVRKLLMYVPEFRIAVQAPSESENDMVRRILESITLEELKVFFSSAVLKAVERIKLRRAEKSKKIIEQAKSFINKNFSEELFLTGVAEFVHLNPTYFSELFKTETGVNYIEYLMEVRINHAKDLLAKTNLKVYEIGCKVGYEEPVSFNRAFRKIVGISPAEYRKIIK